MKFTKDKFITLLFILSVSINMVLIILNDQANTINAQLITANEEKQLHIEALNQTIDELDVQLQDLSNTNHSYIDELNELRSRSELYDKYEYAIMNEMNTRTNLQYYEIKLGEELMIEKGFNPHLLFGSIMVESGADPNAVNELSGATGYGQFLDSTAEFVWNDLLGYGNYYSEIRKDGPSNILMMAEYYDYLYSTKGSTFEVIKQYSGNATNEGAQRYLSKINDYTNQVGVVIN